MAQPTKTQYYDDVVVVCTNGDFEYVLGMTIPELTIDVCGRSHPFYTGQKGALVDTAGRIDRFQARLGRMDQQVSAKKDKTKKSRKFKQTLADLNQSSDDKKPVKQSKKKVEATTQARQSESELKIPEIA